MGCSLLGGIWLPLRRPHTHRQTFDPAGARLGPHPQRTEGPTRLQGLSHKSGITLAFANMDACPLYIDKTETDLKTGFGASRGPTQAKPGQDPQGPGTHQGATPAKNQQQRKEGGRGRTPEAQTDRQDKRQHDRQASRHHDRQTDRQRPK